MNKQCSSPTFCRMFSCMSVTKTDFPEAPHYHVYAARNWSADGKSGSWWDHPPWVDFQLVGAKKMVEELRADGYNIVWIISCDDNCVGDMLEPAEHVPYWTSTEWMPAAYTRDTVDLPRRYDLGAQVALAAEPCPRCGSVIPAGMVGTVIGLVPNWRVKTGKDRSTQGPFYRVGSILPRDVAGFHEIGTNLIFSESELLPGPGIDELIAAITGGA